MKAVMRNFIKSGFKVLDHSGVAATTKGLLLCLACSLALVQPGGGPEPLTHPETGLQATPITVFTARGHLAISSVDSPNASDGALSSEDAAIIRESFEAAQSRSLELTPAPEAGAPTSEGPVDGSVATATAPGISVAFVDPNVIPAAAQAAIVAAADEWTGVLDLQPDTPPIVILVDWGQLGSPTALGSAAPLDAFVVDPPGPVPSSVVTAAQSIGVAGHDLNGAMAEVHVFLNSEAPWGFGGPEQQPGIGEFDLYTVVLHEIAHGLGFLSGQHDLDSDGVITNLFDDGLYYSYDHLLTDTAGDWLLADGATLVPGERVLARYSPFSGGLAAQVFNPADWVPGSSVSHLDPNDDHTHGPEGGEVMEPAIFHGQSKTLDWQTIHIFHAMGWPMKAGVFPPKQVDVEQATVAVGQTITATWALDRAGVDGDSLGLFPEKAKVEILDSEGAVVAGQAVDPHRTSTSLTGLTLDPGKYRIRVSHSVAYLGVRWGEEKKAASLSSWFTVAEELPTTSPSAGPSCNVPAPSSQYANTVASDPIAAQSWRLYSAYFLRQPDLGGFNYWLGVIRANYWNAGWGFLNSVEFQNRYGDLSDGEFVDLVYGNVLCRQPDANGRRYWMSQLSDGMPRQTLMASFAESSEYLQRTGTSFSFFG